MNNFEKACFDSCEKWVNSIEETQEPIYSSNHIKKMNAILYRNRGLFNRKTFIVLVACILLLVLNIVAFAYIGSQTKSKDLIFYSQNPIKIGGYESGSSIRVRVKGANSKNDKLIENLEYGYIPEGYVDLLIDEHLSNKYAWGYENGKYRIFNREFERYENGEVADRIYVTKVVESNGMNVQNAKIYTDSDKTGEELMDDLLNNNGIEAVSPDLYELMERVTDFEENGIHYYFIAPKDEGEMGGELYWDYDGYLYILTGYNLPLEELIKIAKDVK